MQTSWCVCGCKMCVLQNGEEKSSANLEKTRERVTKDYAKMKEKSTKANEHQ